MNRKEISTSVEAMFNKRLSPYQLDVIEFLLQHPGLPPTKMIRISKTMASPKTIMGIYKNLKFLGILTPQNTVKLVPVQIEIRHFLLPEFIRSGKLPPVDYKHTHLAAKLADMKKDEVFEGLTKDQHLTSWKERCDSNTEKLHEVVYRLQNDLAQLAMYGGDLTAFKDMQGTNQFDQQQGE